MNVCERAILGMMIATAIVWCALIVWRSRRDWWHAINAHRIEGQAKRWGMPE